MGKLTFTFNKGRNSADVGVGEVEEERSHTNKGFENKI